MITEDIYIIKITPYRESSNLYDVIAKNYGKLTIIHKGVKNNNKKNSLELFVSYRASWSGKSSIKLLRDYEIVEAPKLSPNLNVIGLYFNELMYYLTQNDYHIEGLYNHYDFSMKSIVNTENILVNLNNYEIGLLLITGHYIIFNSNIDGEHVSIDSNYKYVPDFGPKQCTNKNEGYSGKTFLALSEKYAYDAMTIKESRVLMKRLIDYYIQPKKIRTREILKYISL
ncbi:MAG: hypothetical protein HN613_05885 [Gammaproteobacteria bacterium]|jgi:DNA repair protein RecO (recombination protein O)|nr:hypothetical protein [Gammaproteobacteria bacterium]MBT7603981.1 hypothetical protein [Gammaproteobacteria bacterium]